MTAHLQTTVAWYAAYTKPRQEGVAVANLQRQGFHTYSPLFKTLRKPAGKSEANLVSAGDPNSMLVAYEPMFPRYVFFQPSSPRHSVATVRSTRGISSIVTFGAEFAVVQPEILQTIQSLEEQRNQAPLQTISPYQPGRRVRLRAAALNGLEGLVQTVSSKRVTILLELLGRQKALKVEHDQIELI